MNILDIDLDFFQNGAEHFISKDSKKRSNDEAITPWSIKSVINFLENRCHLSKDRKIPGYVVEHHHEVLGLWASLIDKKDLNTPFSVYHIDAHADLGLGDTSWVHILGDLIHKPLKQRKEFTFNNNTELNCGNYLTYAVANQWLSSLHFIINKSWSPDLHPFYIKPKTNIDYGHHNLKIQLRKFNPEQIDNIELEPEPIGYEPEIAFEIIPFEKFNENKHFDYIFLSKSPNYTKPETDKLIPIISKYIEIIQQF